MQPRARAHCSSPLFSSPATMARITAFVAAATLCNAWTPARQIRPRSLQLRAADEDFDVDMMLLETEEKMQKSSGWTETKCCWGSSSWVPACAAGSGTGDAVLPSQVRAVLLDAAASDRAEPPEC